MFVMHPHHTHNFTSTHITLVTVVGRLVLHATLVTDLLPCSHQLLPQNLDVLDGLHQAVSDGKQTVRDVKSLTLTHPQICTHAQRDILLDHLVGVLVADLDGASHIPGDMNHGDDRLHLLHLVPLEALQGELILVRWGSKNHTNNSEAASRRHIKQHISFVIWEQHLAMKL